MPEGLQLHSREVNLSGNILHFKIPEDFSRDMPAEDLVERLDIERSPQIRKEGYFTLMRRWWDIKNPGFWGKQMGTVMMSITVRARPENQAEILRVEQYDFHSMLHFVIAFYDSLEQRYREHNKQAELTGNGEFSVFIPELIWQLGNDVHSSYKSVMVNHRSWLAAETIQGKQVNKFYVIPLTNKQWLEIEFGIMPNDNAVPYDFVDLAMVRVNKITETFDLQYAEGNEFDRVTSKDWKNKTVLGELESKQNADQLIPQMKQ